MSYRKRHLLPSHTLATPYIRLSLHAHVRERPAQITSPVQVALLSTMQNTTPKRTRKTEWYWTSQRDDAAECIALDALTDAAIAKQVGVATRTIADWKLVPEFATRVAENRNRYRAEAEADRARIRSTGYAVIEARVQRKCERLRQLEEVRLARARLATSDAEWAGKRRLYRACSTSRAIYWARTNGYGCDRFFD